ncbi:DMT family transporter [Microbacterium sp. KSW2-21]|uniref:DMT family transporter n=1 Tax=Microbacterium algihabitans TaxID=3075992 RepID=A0ABU3RRU1_9MICO|nr:DMT family transporter [Microbacterium sp. KSW2-21]MDU0325548.1 DMT family transporter [Microbacterium sp. KSW2-21]
MQSASGYVSRRGLVWGGLGVVAFSFTVIFTRVAVAQLDPLFVGAGRAVVAAAIAAVALAVTRSRMPSARQAARLAIVGGGVVLGFPLLTSFALTSAPASHGAVVIAALPAATAVAAVLRTRERPGRGFWIAAAIGAVVAVAFAVGASGGEGLHATDLLLLGAVVAAAVGYAEGGVLARELGAWQTISWALVLSSPVMVGLTLFSAIRTPVTADPAAWGSFAYLAVVSMFLGFVAWYRGLAIGPMARVSQLQLAQPVLSLGWAALVLGESLTLGTVAGGLAVIACAAIAVTIRQRSAGPPAPVSPEATDAAALTRSSR